MHVHFQKIRYAYCALWACVALSPKGLEPPIGLTGSHLAPDRRIRSSTTQHWSDNRLSSNSELSSLKNARMSGNVGYITGQAT